MYGDLIDAKWNDHATQMRFDEKLGDAFFVDGMPAPIAMGLVAAAAPPPEKIRTTGVKFYDMHPGAWDPDARLAEQDRDGVHAEVIYPTVGRVLWYHADLDYKAACFAAYNRWIAGYCAKHPARLIGIGQQHTMIPERVPRSGTGSTRRSWRREDER
jgi:hypothetical protein